MKKTLFAILTLAAMVACSKDDTVEEVKYPITFGNAFVENSTRATATLYSSTSLPSAFYVYGTVTGFVGETNESTVPIFDGDEVEKQDDNSWKCTEVHYWVPECNYVFAALTDVDGTNVKVDTENGLPSTVVYETSCQKDLLYATTSREVGATADTFSQEAVEFTFDHLLTKVNFTFKNNFSEASGVELTITDLTLNAPAKGTYTFGANPTWAVNETATVSGEKTTFEPVRTPLDFTVEGPIAAGGDSKASSEALIIPAYYRGSNTGDPKALEVTFTIEHNKGGNPTPKTITIPATDFLAGHSYNLIAELDASNVDGVVPVTFKITANETWGDDAVNNPVGPLYPASDQDE